MTGLPGRTDPFTVLGLPARAGLTDDDVRSAWRRVATATHPDRADGGDPGRFAEAAAAYTVLRTRSGRGEALADLASPSAGPRPGRPSRWPRPAGSGGVQAPAAPPRPSPGRPSPERADEAPSTAALPATWRVPPGVARLLARIRRGRPARLALRVLIAAAVGAVAVAVDGFQPATPALITGALTWLLLTAPRDLAP